MFDDIFLMKMTTPPYADSSSPFPRQAETDVDYDKHKADSLKKQKEGVGHWKRELSSDSEEAVKADRNSSESIEQLQKRTKQAAEETSKAGTSTRDGL